MDWLIFISITTLLLQTVSSEETNYTNAIESSRVLSRRKRYLLFPEGSSFQLVFCVQTSALIPIGDIFLYGNTAALAWMLPTDPQFFAMVKEGIKPARRSDVNEIFYLDEDGKVIAKVPYKRKKFINPAFAKRSTDEQTYKEKLRVKIDRMKMHERQMNREYLKREHMNSRSIEFHRQSRVGLYEKIEKLLSAVRQGGEGRQCILRKLCEAGRDTTQGTFLQELLRVIFTLPKGEEFDNEEHKAYDEAHGSTGDCTELYPDCEDIRIRL